MAPTKTLRLRRWHAWVALLAAVVAIWIVGETVPFGSHVFVPDQAPRADGDYAYAVPLDPESPWPKFRANAVQSGRSPVAPRVDPARRPWEFRTGRGVFASPVVDAAGTAYIGSADHFFYAIDQDGRLLWKLETGGVIDSSALLDDRGHVYLGSGDARVYALDRASGALVWSFAADPVEVVEARYGIDSHNVDWFEGSLAMLADGTLLAPNDNFLIYAIDRDTGSRRGEYLGNEVMWSLPALNPHTGRIFAGSQYLLWRNLFAFDTGSGESAWTSGGWGSNAASPLLTSTSTRGALVLGGFDGFVRAYAQASGKQLWKRGTRGHVYASPAQLSDGTLIQPSTDGTLYALEPTTGEVKWVYDTLEPMRSSPAVDARNRIYVGGGDGRLYCLDPDGTLRWSYLLIADERNDLNGSPALGPAGVYVAGENGGVFFVPYDYPLTPAGRRDPRSAFGPGEDLPGEGALLLYTTPFGGLRLEPPERIDANQPLAFTLLVRERDQTVKAAIDRSDLEVRVGGDPPMRVEVSGDAQFLTLVPQEAWTGPEGGVVRVDVEGSYRARLSRFGLKFFGGSRGGSLAHRFEFRVPSRTAGASPLRPPREPGGRATVFELSRFAAPNPTMLPSWNQIGFDSLHYLGGLVEGTQERALLWVVAGRVGEDGTRVDPNLELRFPLVAEYDRGLLSFHNYDGFEINFVGSWDMPFGLYRVSTVVDADGAVHRSAALVAVAKCDELEYYGKFLELMGMADMETGEMPVFGGLDVALYQGDAALPPAAAEVGAVSFSRDASSATASVSAGSLRRADHVFSLLLVDAESGRALPLDYTHRTAVRTNAQGEVTSVSVGFGALEVRGAVRAYYLVDVHPAAQGRI
jgi:outer membrane protein assembly factor BamB